MSAEITVVVQGVAGRGPAWEQSRASIEASDIGTDYEVMVHPPELTGRQHFLSVLRRLAAAPTPLGLRLEDDVIVGRHLLHNLVTWDAPLDPRFGAGWAFAPGGFKVHPAWRHAFHHQARLVPDKPWHERKHITTSVAVLFRTADLPPLIEQIEQQCAAEPHRQHKMGQDILISEAVWRLGKRVAVHRPSLVEHPQVPSTLGHKTFPVWHTSNGTFKKDWRRQ